MATITDGARASQYTSRVVAMKKRVANLRTFHMEPFSIPSCRTSTFQLKKLPSTVLFNVVAIACTLLTLLFSAISSTFIRFSRVERQRVTKHLYATSQTLPPTLSVPQQTPPFSAQKQPFLSILVRKTVPQLALHGHPSLPSPQVNNKPF